MPWFLTFGSLRRASQFLCTHQRKSILDLRKCERNVTISFHLPQYRYYSHYRFPNRGFGSFLFYNTKDHFCRGGFSKNHPLISASSILKHRAHLSWRRVLQKYNFSNHSFTRVHKIAQALRLVLTRSHLVFPSIFGLACGQVAWAQRKLVDTDPYPLKNSFYMQAQNGHGHMKSFIFSLMECVSLLARAFYLAILFSPSIMMAPFVDVGGPQFRKLWLQVVHRTLEKAGPAFIKWGQWAAARPDLFPKDLCKKLSELHSNAPKHSFAHTKKTVEEAFGRQLSEIFVSFEEEPIASGSIAQVHRASLRYRLEGKHPGEQGWTRQVKPMLVAVKVRHPGVGESIRRDFMIIKSVAKISSFVPALKWLDESVQQFAVIMMSQVDLANEAANLNRFIYNFRKRKNVSFPKPEYPFVHPAVLVETYEQGESISHYVDDDLEGHKQIKIAIADIGTEAILKMLLVDNFLHADLHPGNILVRPPKKKSSKWQPLNSKPQVIFIDAGMTAELSKSDQVNLVGFFKAVARRDGRTAAESLLRLTKQQKCPNPGAFIKEVEESFTFWGTAEGDVIHPAECMEQLIEKVRHHKVNVDGNVCTVLVTALVLEGWQRKLHPAYNVMETLKTLLLFEDWAKRLSYITEPFSQTSISVR